MLLFVRRIKKAMKKYVIIRKNKKCNCGMNKKDKMLERELVIAYKAGETEIIDEVLTYFRRSDFMYKRQDANVFKELYCSKYNICSVSVTYMCNKLYISESSLRRYRKNYMKIVRFIKNEKKGSE